MKLTFVTGKGGVGKSTVTAGMATALASLKYKVGVIELGETRMSDFFKTPPLSYEGTKANSHITLFNLHAGPCFEEYIGRHLPKPALMALKNRWVQHFIDAVPGLNEILILGKITSLLEEESFDFLFVDAPATGHTISLCDAPRIALGALNKGPLKSTVRKILDLLYHSGQTGFLLVSQLEGFIVEETVELYHYLIKNLKLSSHGLLINGQEQNCISIPDTFPQKPAPHMKPLINILLAKKAKIVQEKKLAKILQKKFKSDLGFLCWDDMLKKERTLGKQIAKELKPWILKNYLKKNA